MVQLLPLRDKKTLARLNEREEITARLGYCLHDGGEITGWLLYDLDGESAIVHAVNAPDEASFDGLVRAVFSSLLDAGINHARFGAGVDRPSLEKLGFVKPGENTVSSIKSILFLCRNCQAGKTVNP